MLSTIRMTFISVTTTYNHDRERLTDLQEGVTMDNFLSTKDRLNMDDIIQFNDYSGTREEFWRETFVVVTLSVSTIDSNILPIIFLQVVSTCRLSKSKL